MTETRTRNHFGWGWLVVGILFIIAAFISFANPVSQLATLAYIFAILAVLSGIWRIITYAGSGLRLVGGILDIIIGVVLLTNIWWTAAALPYIFAIWFIADSLVRLFTVGITRLLGPGYFWLSLILNILGVIVGVMLLFNPVTAALTLSFLVGFYLLLAGIESISLAFARPGLR